MRFIAIFAMIASVSAVSLDKKVKGGCIPKEETAAYF